MMDATALKQGYLDSGPLRKNSPAGFLRARILVYAPYLNADRQSDSLTLLEITTQIPTTFRTAPDVPPVPFIRFGLVTCWKGTKDRVRCPHIRRVGIASANFDKDICAFDRAVQMGADAAARFHAVLVNDAHL